MSTEKYTRKFPKASEPEFDPDNFAYVVGKFTYSMKKGKLIVNDRIIEELKDDLCYELARRLGKIMHDSGIDMLFPGVG